MHLSRYLLALASLLSVSACQTPGPQLPAYDLAITNVTTVDAHAGSTANQTVLIAGERIAAVLPGSTRVARDVRHLDGSGRFLTPGLWDLHVHITYEPALAATFPSLLLDYGITSVRDTGGVLPVLLPAVERWRTSAEPTPHLYFSGPLLDGRMVVYDGNDRPLIGVANATPAAARQQVARLKQAGASFIKIYEMVEDDVFDALVAAAAEAQLPIAAHVPLAVAPLRAGPQLGSLEHLRNLELACSDIADDLLTARRARIEDAPAGSGFTLRSALHAAQRERAYQHLDLASPGCQAVLDAFAGTVQVPTLRLNTLNRFSPAQRDDWAEALTALPAPIATAWQRNAERFAERVTPLGVTFADASMEITRTIAARGGTIGAGTDTPIGQSIPGYALHTELERMVDAGLSPRQALAAATLAPATFFRWPELEQGRVAAGHPADLLLLDGNPLDDIRHTREIRNVILRGAIVRSFDEP